MKKIKSTTCYIGLGSNLDDPKSQLNNAIKTLSESKNINIKKISSFYKTKPVGYDNQPDFVNAVVSLNTNFSAAYLIDYLLKIELSHQRVRGENKNMPRTLDLDVLLYGNKNIKTKKLNVPHPRMKDRAFVLVPLYEISPKLVRKFLGPVDFIRKFKLSNEFKLNKITI